MPHDDEDRRELAVAYEHGRRLSQAGRFEDAHTVFQQCIERDPGRLRPIDAMLQNLVDLHRVAPPSWTGRWTDSAAKRLSQACRREDWLDALRHAPSALRARGPSWPLLRSLAHAAQQAKLPDVELRYWHAVLEHDAANLETLNEAAFGFAWQGAFADARECWVRIRKIDPNHRQARDRLDILGRFGEPGQAELAKMWLSQSGDQIGVEWFSMLEEWAGQMLFDAAEVLLQAAAETSAGGWTAQERADGLEVQRKSAQLAIAIRFAELEQSERANELAHRLAEDLNRLELGLFDRRSQRFPGEPRWRLELARRLRVAEMYYQAAEQFEMAATAETAAECMLEQGECLQKVCQFERALKCYLAAVDLLDEREPRAATGGDCGELCVRGWRRLAVLSEAMGRTEHARRSLTWLLQHSPEDQQLRARLDKLPAIGDKG